MAKVFNRVRQSTATTGTGTITLGAAVAQHQTFATANAANGDVCSYAIEDGTAWEVGIGTYASAGPTLTRTLIGSSTGSLLNLSGAAQVFSTPLVHDIGPPIGQCVLTLSAGSLLLSPRNGYLLPINGRLWPVPSAGVSLAVTGLTSGTLYYIYAFMSGSTMTLEASTTTHATDAATGVEIKSGDATRTLVGMARPIAGPAWVDTPAQRLVRSWFPSRGVETSNNFGSAPTTTSTTFVEINSVIRNEALMWAHECWFLVGSGSVLNSGTSNVNVGVGIDGAAPADSASGGQPSGAGFSLSGACAGRVSTGNEGYHYATIMGKANAGTATFGSVTDAPARYFGLQGVICK